MLCRFTFVGFEFQVCTRKKIVRPGSGFFWVLVVLCTGLGFVGCESTRRDPVSSEKEGRVPESCRSGITWVWKCHRLG